MRKDTQKISLLVLSLANSYCYFVLYLSDHRYAIILKTYYHSILILKKLINIYNEVILICDQFDDCRRTIDQNYNSKFITLSKVNQHKYRSEFFYLFFRNNLKLLIFIVEDKS